MTASVMSRATSEVTPPSNRLKEISVDTLTPAPRKSLISKYKSGAVGKAKARLLKVVPLDEVPASGLGSPKAPPADLLQLCSQHLGRFEEAVCEHIDQWLEDATKRIREEVSTAMFCNFAREQGDISPAPAELGRLEAKTAELAAQLSAQEARLEALREEFDAKTLPYRSVAPIHDILTDLNEQREGLDGIKRQLDMDMPCVMALQASVTAVCAEVETLRANHEPSLRLKDETRWLHGKTDAVLSGMRNAQSSSASSLASAPEYARMQEEVGQVRLHIKAVSQNLDSERKVQRNTLEDINARVVSIADGLTVERRTRQVGIEQAQLRLMALSSGLDQERTDRRIALEEALVRLDRLAKDVSKMSAAAAQRAERSIASASSLSGSK